MSEGGMRSGVSASGGWVWVFAAGVVLTVLAMVDRPDNAAAETTAHGGGWVLLWAVVGLLFTAAVAAIGVIAWGRRGR